MKLTKASRADAKFGLENSLFLAKGTSPRFPLKRNPSDPGSESGGWELEDESFKEVFFPNCPPHESSIRAKLRSAFVAAGYRVMRVQDDLPHPVIVARLVRRTAPRIKSDQLHRHIRSLLQQVGFCLRKTDLTVGQNGDRIMVAFQWKDSPLDYAAALRQAEQGAAEFADMPL